MTMLKAKQLREKSTEELLKHLEELNKEIAKWKAGQHHEGAGDLPSSPGGTISWGLARRQKRNKAIILTVLNERGIKK